MEAILAIATCVLAIVTGLMAYYTASMAKATLSLANESREASFRQIGVQTWLEFTKRFDSPELIKARDGLAQQIRIVPSHPKKLVSDTLMNFFEDLGIVYRLGYIDKKLADDTFSYYVCRWWEVSKPYVEYERKTHNGDKTIFSEFENLALLMKKAGETIDANDIKVFLQDEKDLQ